MVVMVRGSYGCTPFAYSSGMIRRIVTFIACLMSAVGLAAAMAASPSFTSREQVEQLLARDLASGSSVATVTRFLDAHGIAHGKAEPSGPSLQLTGTVAGLRDKAARISLQVRFSFLQDRLIGYSFSELPAADR
jgi:hypothetical protein